MPVSSRGTGDSPGWQALPVKDAILAYNVGSSSIKFAVFSRENDRLCDGAIRGIGSAQAGFSVRVPEATSPTDRKVSARDHEQALGIVLDWLNAKGRAGA